MTRVQHTAELVAIDSLKPYPTNARRGNVDMIRRSLKANGQYRPVVVRIKTREVLAGNHTLLAAQAEGWSELWATFIDVDARTAKRIVLIDNRSNDVAGYDEQALADLLGSLPEADLADAGYGKDELERLLERLNPDPESAAIAESFEILISCGSEQQQTELLERLNGEGFECHALIS